MPYKRLFFILCLVPLVGEASSLTELSPAEQKEVDARLQRFYRNPADPAPMKSAVPRFDLRQRTYLPARNSRVNGARNPESDRAYCDNVLKKFFPTLYRADCEPRPNASVEQNDKLDDLVDGWIDLDQVAYYLDYIPASGQTSVPVWADDYWKTKWGGLSYRYSGYDEKKEFKTYREAVGSYAQPGDWLGMKGIAVSELSKRVLPWSPSEKYDLLLGDEGFTLTNQQKRLGERWLGPSGDVEDWMGICHGWTAASLMVPAPMKPTTTIGVGGVPVTWYPADVRALVSLAWANGGIQSDFVGGRCTEKDPELYPNGRIKNPDCFETNPATLHLALGNLIGRQKLTFIMDKSFNYEVWNQPVIAYQFTYFNPLHPEKKSADWKEVAVDYNDDFRARDRFNHPLTRGTRTEASYDDSGIRKVVGVIATVVYVVETSPPSFSETPDRNPLERVVYTYDLELHDSNGHLYPMGGEWQQNAHPNFLWLPRKDSVPATGADQVALGPIGAEAPTAAQAELAREASAEGAPLCAVVKELVKRSTGRDSYRCPL